MNLPFQQIGNAITMAQSKGFLNKAIDRNDSSVDPTNLFLIAITIIGLILLIVPAIAILIEVWYNHTISTDLSGMAAYITSVVALFASGGITAAWTNWAHAKYNVNNNVTTDTTTDTTDTAVE